MGTMNLIFKLNQKRSIVLLLVVVVWDDVAESGKAAKSVATGSTCTKLEDPGHGRFQCKEQKGGQECVLVCFDDYIQPNNEYYGNGKHISPEKRGIYRCVSNPGGLSWSPNFFFDCIPKVQPVHFVYYLDLSLDPFPNYCSNGSGKAEVMANFQPNKPEKGSLVEKFKVDFGVMAMWSYDMMCLEDVWRMDVWLKIPFTDKTLDSFQEWSTPTNEQVPKDALSFFTLDSQLKTTEINNWGFYIQCPKATRLERDFTCRGCSRGYYMAPDLLECLPCPASRYQDQDFSQSCKPCPGAGPLGKTGLKRFIDCFHFSFFEEHTSMNAILGVLACIVVLAAVVLGYRSQVKNEPDGIHKEKYVDTPLEPVGGGPLQWLMRRLAPPDYFPSQLDSMRMSVYFGDDALTRRSMAVNADSSESTDSDDDDEDEKNVSQE